MGYSAPSPDAASAEFRIAFVPGVTLGKWSRIWQERVSHRRLKLMPISDADQVTVLRDHLVEMCFARLPIDHTGLSVIPLYRETPVVVIPRDHVVAAFDRVDLAELADEQLLNETDTVPDWREAIESVAMGAGIVIVPKSVARLHHRKDLVYRPVTGVAESQIALAWVEGSDDPLIETFIGIVRGRTERSSRG